MKKSIIILAAAIIALSCAPNGQSEQAATYADDVDYRTETAAGPTDRSISLDDTAADTARKKIIKNGRIGISVGEPQAAKRKIDSLTKACGGYLAGENYYTYDYELGFVITARVPEQNFDKFVDGIEAGGGRILYKELSARDVTEQFVDIETRLANKRVYLARYRELVKQARTIKEVLEVEEHIRALEEEIESAEGRLRYLGDQTAYGTLEIKLSKTIPYKFEPEKNNFFQRLKKSLAWGWSGFVDVCLGLITLWPLMVALAAVFVVIRRRRKSKSRK